jgi:deoxyribose-phosphate aldolase
MDILTEIITQAKAYLHELPPFCPPVSPPQGKAIAGWLDHTLLKPEATVGQVKQLCEEARAHHFASACVNPIFIPLAANLLVGTEVKVCATIGFPLGAVLPTVKVFEALACISAGATEIDMVIHIGGLKAKEYGALLNEIQGVAQIVHTQGGLLKVILETALLTEEEKIFGCLIAQAGGADFVKTSTGFGPGGATVADVRLMRCVVGPDMGVKAAGGIRTHADALAMIQAGANRLGTSSGVKIVQEA